MVVWSVEGKKMVVEHEAGRLLLPASTTKLVTMFTALDQLGSAFEWRTALYMKGKPESREKLAGDLVVVGDGDPNISGRFHDGDSLFLFRKWAGILKDKGLRQVTGDLVLDTSAFGGPFVHPDWEAGELDRWYAAAASALSLNDNCVDVFVAPGTGPGAPATVSLHPDAGHVELLNRMTTTAKKSEHLISVWRAPGTNRVSVEGRCWTGSAGETVWIAIDRPDLFFGRAFLQILAESGIEVGGEVRVAEGPVDVSEAFRVDVFRSGMEETLAVLAKRSQNFYAEQLYKRCGLAAGGPGNWETGREAVARSLEKIGIARDAYVSADGSGLSRKNRFSAGHLLKILAAAWEGPDREIFFGALPISGTDGTLADRMESDDLKGKVRAKTGTMTGVSGLAGVVEGKSGRYLFAFVGEGSVADLRQAQEAICRALAAN